MSWMSDGSAPALEGNSRCLAGSGSVCIWEKRNWKDNSGRWLPLLTAAKNECSCVGLSPLPGSNLSRNKEIPCTVGFNERGDATSWKGNSPNHGLDLDQSKLCQPGKRLVDTSTWHAVATQCSACVLSTSSLPRTRLHMPCSHQGWKGLLGPSVPGDSHQP